MKYQHYTPLDFALDKDFQHWVLHPDQESSQFWNNWLRQNPDKQNDIKEAIEMVRLAGLSADHDANTTFLEGWEKVHAHAQKTERNRRINQTFRYTRIAAVWIAFILIATYLIVFWNKNQPVVSVTYATKFGEIKKVLLPDGSRITLNANSSLRLSAEDWTGKATREVFLKGEAFFEIARTSDRKRFIVKTADSVAVQVLGTEFNVNTRREKTAVYLQSGKVEINATDEKVVLKPGDFAEYTKQENTVNIRQGREESKLAWKNNFFVFDDTSLLDIAYELEDNYGTRVIIADDSLAQKRFTARIPRNKATVLLKVLAETLQIDITQQNNVVYMKPKHIPDKE